ncbi:MAG: phage tail terminator-like protein [Sulfuricella sp.]
MSQKIVRAGLEKKLKAWADAQTLPVAWENIGFTAPATAYVRAFLLPEQVLSQTLDKLHRRFAGILQVDLVMPINGGAAPAETLLASLLTAFNPATSFTESGVLIYITDPASAAPALTEANRYTVPVSIPYAAHVI